MSYLWLSWLRKRLIVIDYFCILSGSAPAIKTGGTGSSSRLFLRTSSTHFFRFSAHSIPTLLFAFSGYFACLVKSLCPLPRGTLFTLFPLPSADYLSLHPSNFFRPPESTWNLTRLKRAGDSSQIIKWVDSNRRLSRVKNTYWFSSSYKGSVFRVPMGVFYRNVCRKIFDDWHGIMPQKRRSLVGPAFSLWNH